MILFLDEQDNIVSKGKRAGGMLVGGFYISEDNIFKIENEIVKIKGKHGLKKNHCVKWNLRDPDCKTAYGILKGKDIEKFRAEMFDLLSKYNARILISFVWKGLFKHSEKAWLWAFENILQRISLMGQGNEANQFEVIMDWPMGNKGRMHDTYFCAFQNAYQKGIVVRSGILPPLESYHTFPALLATKNKFSQCMQLNDFVVGLTGDFFKWTYRGKRESNLRKYFKKIYVIFRTKPGKTNVLGYGLIVPENSRKKISKSLQRFKPYTNVQRSS